MIADFLLRILHLTFLAAFIRRAVNLGPRGQNRWSNANRTGRFRHRIPVRGLAAVRESPSPAQPECSLRLKGVDRVAGEKGNSVDVSVRGKGGLGRL